METNKIKAYLGFCIRSGGIVFGVDNIEQHRKRAYLIIVDKDLSENSMKTIEKSNERLNCPVLQTEDGLLEQLLCRPTVKAVLIRDKNLAAAILSAANGNPKFNLYSGGNN